MPITISDTNTESATDGVKIFVYGRPGVGKTCLCATAPNPKILSAERGLLSLSKANQIRLYGKAINIPVLVINTIEDLEEAYQLIVDNPDPDANGEETICLDSISEIAEKILSHSKGQYSDGRQAYGDMMDRMAVVLKKFRDLPKRHVLMICKEGSRGSDSATLYGPSLPGKTLANDVGYVPDELFHLAVGKHADGTQYRYLQTQPDIQFDAKDRSGALDLVENPNLTTIIRKIQHNG